MLKLLTVLLLAGVPFFLAEARKLDDTALGLDDTALDDQVDLSLEPLSEDELPDLKRIARGKGRGGNRGGRSRRPPKRRAPPRAKAESKHITTRTDKKGKVRKEAKTDHILKDKSTAKKPEKNSFGTGGWFKDRFKQVLDDNLSKADIVNHLLQGLFYTCECNKDGENVHCQCCATLPKEMGCITMDTSNEGNTLDLKIQQYEGDELTMKKDKYSCTINIEKNSSNRVARKAVYKSGPIAWAHVALKPTTLSEDDADGRACFLLRLESARVIGVQTNVCIIEEGDSAYVQKMDDIIFNAF